MGRLPPGRVRTIQRRVFSWYSKHQRELQWRTTRDPYQILVSEIMLQQTQVRRVQEKLPNFLRKFPTLQHLAASTKADVIHAWEGMGYNNRAIRLRAMAKEIFLNHDGTIPADVQALLRLSGIGPYSAHAVACFGFRQKVPVVDTNIRRVLSRLFWKMKTRYDKASEKEIWRNAEQILPRDSYTWNQALMDLGSVICTARKPLCGLCPVNRLCSSRHLQNSDRSGSRAPGKPEPSHDAIPQRIWRGKIIQVLRSRNGMGAMRLEDLGTAIKQNFKKKELPWLARVVEKLRKDGLVESRSLAQGVHIMLAST